MFSFKYKSHYFSIENIIATQERVPCRFTKKVMFMGHLDSSSDENDIKPGTKLELPYWMVRSLTDPVVDVIEVESPKFFKESYRDILTADANVVDLHKMSKHYYQFGKLLSQLDSLQGKQLRSLLVQTFKDRFRKLLDWAQNMGADQLIAENLDDLEKQFLINSRDAQIKLNKWLEMGAGHIVAAEMVLNHKKRKLSALEVF
uniref:DNA replication complex GINS protein PSF3 n=2 Tax=Clastoptera arizonana TaxID=38151 RepID=A0A1B6C2G2_9HEMI